VKSCWLVVRDGRCVLEHREAPVPQPAPGTIVVRVRASALNRGEFIVGSVMHGGQERIGGTEVAGTVHAVGVGVTRFREGDRVMGRLHGGWAEYALMNAYEAMPVPERLGWEQAAAMPVAMLVAYDALVTFGRLRAAEWVLVLGASAGTAVACIQVAKVLGARVLGTSGSAEKLERLRGLGLDLGIRTRAPDFAGQVRKLTGGAGADLALNFVGGSYLPEAVRSLARRGRLAVIGYVDHTHEAKLDLQAVHANRLQLFGMSNSKTPADEREQTVGGFVRDVLPLYEAKGLQPVVDRVFDFGELAAAHAYMESNANLGKVVVRIG